jgi:hypothetical protein
LLDQAVDRVLVDDPDLLDFDLLVVDLDDPWTLPSSEKVLEQMRSIPEADFQVKRLRESLGVVRLRALTTESTARQSRNQKRDLSKQSTDLKMDAD